MKIEKNNIAEYRTQDLISSESFIDWVKAGKPQGNAWCKYIEDYPQLSLYISEAQEIIEQISFREDTIRKYRVARIKGTIDAKIHEDGIKKKELHSLGDSKLNEGKRRRLISFVSIAAAVVAIIITTFVVLNEEKEVENTIANRTISKQTDSGQKLTVHLRDGSTVKMNSESSLTYSDFFSDTSRIVYLKGEAFFDVAKDPDRPFRVVTESTVTTAIGTAFNIKSERKNNSTAVSLQSGKVSVENLTSSGDVVFLAPGQQAFTMDKEPTIVRTFEFDLLDWKEGILVFKKDSHQNVFEKLEKWYGVEFKVNLSGRKQVNWDYTGRFDNETLENILESIGYVKKFTFEIKNKEVLITLN
ncbi:MAG: FecR domain-containing protein [Cyclobacteriaceae bacterium]